MGTSSYEQKILLPWTGPPPKRFVVIQFDSVKKAKAWNATPQVAEINAIRAKATKSRSFVVEGF
jgi:uncharacterized protein (DUF1330 family)